MKRILILIASTIMILTLASCSDTMGLNKTVEVNTIPNTTVNKRTFPVVSDVYDTVNNTKYNTQTKATESSTESTNKKDNATYTYDENTKTLTINIIGDIVDHVFPQFLCFYFTNHTTKAKFVNAIFA